MDTRKDITRRHFSMLAGGTLIAAPAIIGRAQAADAPIPFKLTYDGYSISTAPLFYGTSNKIFDKYGLALTLAYMDGGTTHTQAIIGGSVDIGQNGYTPCVAAAVQGADICVIANVVAKLPFQLVVKKGLTKADLHGKKIAVSRFGSQSDTAATYALTHLGLKRSDVAILQLGGEGTRTAAMMSGQIDGSMEQLPHVAQMVDTGKFDVLVDCTIVAGDYPNTGYMSRHSWVREHRDIVKKFVMGLSASIHSFKQDKPGATKAIADLLKIPNDDAVAKTWESFSRDVYPDIPYPPVKGLQIILDNLAKKDPKAATVKPEAICDTTAIDELVKEGFYKKLLGA